MVDGEPSIEPEDVALAIPRLLLAPPRLALQIVYFPIYGALYLMDRYKIPEHVIDFLYNDERTAAVLPYFSFLGGQGPTVGVSAFHGGWGRYKEKLAFSAKFGGRYQQAYELSFEAPSVAGSPFGLDVYTRFEMAPHLRFYGYGPGGLDPAQASDAPVTLSNPEDRHVETAYRQRRSLVRLRADYHINPAVSLGLIESYNVRHFDEKYREDEPEPSIGEVYDTSRIVGFDAGYALSETLLDFVVDTRPPGASPSRGVYFNAFAGGAPPQKDYGFARIGAELTAFVDVYHGDRILAFHAAHESVLGNDEEIPFAELPRLGGPRKLRGYDLDRFRGKHTLMTAVEYRYPIHDYVNGSVFFEVGSVGMDIEELVHYDNYRYGGGGGLIFGTKTAELFSVQLAYGESLQFFVTTDPLTAFTQRGGEQL